MQNNNKIFGLIGIARKANKTVDGETLYKAISKQKVSLVFLANDASKNSTKKMKNKCLYYHIKLVDCFSSEQLSDCIGKTNRMAIGIVDLHIANQLVKLVEGGGINGRYKKEKETCCEE